MTLFVDLSEYLCIEVRGGDRLRFVGGMCTGNVAKLAQDVWLRTCMLNAKGRVLSVFDLLKRDESLLLVCEPALLEPTIEVFQRHAIIDDVEFSKVKVPMHRVWSTPKSVWETTPVLGACPSPRATDDQIEVLRVEAGWPKYGVDVSEKAFPFESLLKTFIDYEKGCYIGQEPVARVHSRGAPQRFLQGVRLEGDGAVATGTAIDSPSKSGAGVVTSSLVSPRHGPIAMGYVHQKAGGTGQTVTIEGRSGTLVELPFD